MKDSLLAVAQQFPDQKFAIIDEKIENVPNVASLSFKEHEGSFLVGALAAMMSKTGTIGFVGGMESPLISATNGRQAGLNCAMRWSAARRAKANLPTTAPAMSAARASAIAAGPLTLLRPLLPEPAQQRRPRPENPSVLLLF